MLSAFKENNVNKNTRRSGFKSVFRNRKTLIGELFIGVMVLILVIVLCFNLRNLYVAINLRLDRDACLAKVLQKFHNRSYELEIEFISGPRLSERHLALSGPDYWLKIVPGDTVRVIAEPRPHGVMLLVNDRIMKRTVFMLCAANLLIILLALFSWFYLVRYNTRRQSNAATQ